MSAAASTAVVGFERERLAADVAPLARGPRMARRARRHPRAVLPFSGARRGGLVVARDQAVDPPAQLRLQALGQRVDGRAHRRRGDAGADDVPARLSSPSARAGSSMRRFAS